MCLNVALGQFHGRWVHGHLARAVYKTISNDGLTVDARKRLWSFVSQYCLLRHGCSTRWIWVGEPRMHPPDDSKMVTGETNKMDRHSEDGKIMLSKTAAGLEIQVVWGSAFYKRLGPPSPSCSIVTPRRYSE